MKKKFLAMYALAGALVASPVFTSCVDSEESASVEALRGAKVEQLKAAAALANAKAQAELTLANAEAALLAAQTAFQQQQTEQAAQLFAITIDSIQAATNKAIAEAEKAIADAMASTQNVDNILLQNYKDAVSELMDLNSELVKAEASVAYKEAGVVYAEANAKVQIAQYEQNIAGYEAQLAVYQDPQYTNINKEELYTQYQEAVSEASLALKALYSKEGAAVGEAGTALKDAYDVWKEGFDLINELNNLCTQGNGIELKWDENASEYLQYYYLRNWNTEPMLEGLGQTFYYEIDETQKLANDRYFENYVKTYADALGTSADTKDKDTAYGKLAAANDQMTTAKAMPETTETEKSDKETAIEDAEDAIALAKDKLAQAQRDYDNAVATKEAYDAAWEAIDLTTINAQREAVVAAYEAQKEAYKAYVEAKNMNYLDRYAKAEALGYLYNNAMDINGQIAKIEKNIAEDKQWIEYYKNEYITESEDALNTLLKEIEYLKAEIEIQTQLVAKAKAALDAALAQ